MNYRGEPFVNFLFSKCSHHWLLYHNFSLLNSHLLEKNSDGIIKAAKQGDLKMVSQITQEVSRGNKVIELKINNYLS